LNDEKILVWMHGRHFYIYVYMYNGLMASCCFHSQPFLGLGLNLIKDKGRTWSSAWGLYLVKKTRAQVRPSGPGLSPTYLQVKLWLDIFFLLERTKIGSRDAPNQARVLGSWHSVMICARLAIVVWLNSSFFIRIFN
jgi:hypothetical protein